MGCLFALLGVADLFFFYWLLSPRDSPPPTAVWAVLPEHTDPLTTTQTLQAIGLQEVRVFAGPEDATLVEGFERVWWRPWARARYTSALDAHRSVLRAIGNPGQLERAVQQLRERGAQDVRLI